MATNAKCAPEIARKVSYEFTMFRFLCDRIRLLSEESGTFLPGEFELMGTSDLSTEAEREEFARLESLLLHARVLREFFYDFDPRHDDDVAAVHFLPDWPRHCPVQGTYLASRKERLDKALAHLTTKRVE